MRAADLAQRLSGQFIPRTPVIVQTETAECGLACLAMIAGHYGHAMDLLAIRRRFSASLKGTSLADLVRLGGAINLATRALRLDLSDLSRLRLPCVLHWSHNHFVVLTQVGAKRVVIHDPATGRRNVSYDELSEQFTGVALEAWPTRTFEKKDERSRIRVMDMIWRTDGLGRVALQILAMSVLLEVVTIAMPIGFQLVLDEVIVAADYDLLKLVALALAFLLILQVTAGLARSWITMLVGSSLALQWKVSLFDQLMRLPLAFFEKRHVGDVVSRFGSIDAVQRTLTTSAIQALLDGVMSITLVAMMSLYAGWLAVIALVSVSLYAALRLIVYAPYRAISEEVIVRTAQENSHFMESVRGIGSVKALNLHERRRGVWVNYLIDRVNAELRVQKFEASFKAASNALFGVDRILLIFFGARLILTGDMSAGTFVAFLAYKDQFEARIDSFIDIMLQFRMLSLHGERLADIALADREDSELSPPRADVGPPVNRLPSNLEIRNVHFRYADSEPEIFAGLSFRVVRGECLGVAGPSGCGKTTLLKLLAGLATPTSGQILIDGVPISSLGLTTYRDRIGCVLQDDRLFAGSVSDNISGFDPSKDMGWIETCARMASIHDEITTMPMGYETLVGDMGSTLSGGQKQRVVLARALYRRPSILLLDEATSHLDRVNETAINEAIKKLPITRIVIAHRETTLAMTDRILRLDGAWTAELSLQR